MFDKIKSLMKIHKFAGTILLKDGTEIFVDGDLETGSLVKIQLPDEDQPVEMPEGEYTLENDDIMVVEGGVIVEIKSPETETETETETEKEPETETEKEPETETEKEPETETEKEPETETEKEPETETEKEPETETEKEPETETPDLEKMVKDLEERIKQLESLLLAKEEEFNKLKKIVDETPADEPLKKKFKKDEKPNQPLSRYERIMNTYK